MRLVLSDVPLPATLPQREENRYIDLTQRRIAQCMGCFGCWVKTPGKCVIRDDATEIYPLIAQSDRLLYVSRVRYGGYDVPLKTMLERAIPVQKAFLRVHEGETHHVQRRVADKDAVILAYGCPTQAEQAVFERLIARNAKNMAFRSWRVRFVEEAALAGAIEEEVRAWEAC